MRTKAGAVATAIALAMLGGCYWTGSEENGAASITASLPRGTILKPTGYTMRAVLYPSRGVSVTYRDASGVVVKDPALADDVTIVPASRPLPIEDLLYWEVPVDTRATSGSFTIFGIPPDVSCRLHLKLLDSTKGGSVVAEGISNDFAVAAGESVGLGVTLFN